jgi:hypothetical protein
MGCKVILFADDEGLETYSNNMWFRAWLRVTNKPWEFHRKQHVSRLASLVKRERPEIVMVLKGLHLGPEDVTVLKAQKSWVVNVNHDDFFSHNRRNWSQLQRRALPAYDFILTTREINVEEISPFNPRVEFFPFAYYPRIHRPLEVPDSERQGWEVDIVFVGTYERERCQLLESLVRRVPASYAIWGSQWNKVGRHSPLVPHIKGRSVIMDEMAKAIGSAKLALAFLRKENRDDYTQRTFEIPACGGVLLAERTARHRSFFREGEEAEFFDPQSPEELIHKTTMLLNSASLREQLRRGGRRAVLQQRQTYRDRMERLMELYHSHRDDMI